MSCPFNLVRSRIPEICRVFQRFFRRLSKFGAKNNLVVVAKGFYIFLERLLWDLSGFGARFAEFSCIFNIYNMISGRELPVV